MGHHIAVRMAESRFVERLWDESLAIDDGAFARVGRSNGAAHFVAVEGRFRTELASFLPDYEVDEDGRRREITDDKALKIVNRIFDVFAPRMFLIGHSQGGLVALRAMQLGMRRVRVKDGRRFLYSPRSGRVHRYSPIALAIGLGAPFDGIAESPSDLVPGRRRRLDESELPGWVRQWMPGVAQMLHGSRFLKEMRGAFIPFDCSAMSIANPKDGFVPLESTRLPVGDFRNMHNLEVCSREAFDVAAMVPPALRPSLGLWPTSVLRRALNEAPRFEGLREHCAFLVDLGANWDVDHGEIVQQIFSGESGESLFDEMMYEVNFDGLREQLMANLLYRLRAASPEERAKLGWMALASAGADPPGGAALPEQPRQARRARPQLSRARVAPSGPSSGGTRGPRRRAASVPSTRSRPCRHASRQDAGKAGVSSASRVSSIVSTNHGYMCDSTPYSAWLRPMASRLSSSHGSSSRPARTDAKVSRIISSRSLTPCSPKSSRTSGCRAKKRS